MRVIDHKSPLHTLSLARTRTRKKESRSVRTIKSLARAHPRVWTQDSLPSTSLTLSSSLFLSSTFPYASEPAACSPWEGERERHSFKSTPGDRVSRFRGLKTLLRHASDKSVIKGLARIYILGATLRVRGLSLLSCNACLLFYYPPRTRTKTENGSRLYMCERARAREIEREREREKERASGRENKRKRMHRGQGWVSVYVCARARAGSAATRQIVKRDADYAQYSCGPGRNNKLSSTDDVKHRACVQPVLAVPGRIHRALLNQHRRLSSFPRFWVCTHAYSGGVK